jgi:hypothetical protein
VPEPEEEPKYGLGRGLVEGIPAAFRSRGMFGDIAAYVTFVGYPRSGHSLVGSLINAHPEALIAHELDAIALIERRFPRSLLFGLLVARDHEFAEGGRRWGQWDYAVPGGSQGTWTSLRVIGDKKGGRTTQRLAANPDLVDRLERTVKVPLRFVHVVRDPFDMAARMSLRGRTLEDAIVRCGRFADDVALIRARVSGDRWHDIRLEGLIADPYGELGSLLGFLGLPSPAGFLEACARVLLPAPHRTSDEVGWTPELTAMVNAIVERHPAHFAGYRR